MRTNDSIFLGSALPEMLDGTLVIQQNKRLLFLSLLSTLIDIIVYGASPLSLPDAAANSLQYVKAFGGTEQRNLPAGYTQVEYLESTGTQYIDTGAVLKSEATITMVAQASSVATGGPYAFWGLMGSGTFPRWGWSVYSTAWLTDLNQTNTASTANTEKHTFVNSCFYTGTDLQYNSFVDGTALFTNARTVSQVETYTGNTLSAYLFARNNEGTAGNFLACKIFSFEVVQDGVKILSVVPARRNSDNVLGMYDTVSGQFLTNAGTGTFTAGADVVPTPDTPVDIVSNNGALKARHQSGLPLGYTLLEYLESPGNQYSYIDTGYNFSAGTKFEVVLNPLNEISSGWFFGANSTGGEVLFSNASIYFGAFRPSSTPTSGFFPTANTIYKITGDMRGSSSDQSSLLIDDNLIWQGRGNFNDRKIYLFAILPSATDESAVGRKNIRVHSFKVWQNDTIVQNLTPCRRDSDNVLGMYDLVSGQFFTNAGTGSFVAGNAVSDPVEVYADGTIETINVHGKNLFDLNTMNTGQGWYNGGGGVANSINANRTIVVPCKPNTKYSIWHTAGRGGWRAFGIADNTTIADGVPIVWSTDTSQTWIDTNVVKTFTTGNTHRMYILAGRRDGESTRSFDEQLADFMVVEGEVETATAYEPYYNGGTATAEMLLKIGDYADEQEILSGAVTRKVGVKVLDGTENIYDGVAGYWGIASSYFPNIKMQSAYVLTTRWLKGDYISQTGAYCSISGLSYFAVNKASLPNISTASGVKQWLADQYAAGTPVIVIYPLATPTTESVAGQALQVQAGDNVVEITQASIDNLELEAQYKKSA